MNKTGCVYVEQLMPADDVLMHSKQSNRRIGNAILATPLTPQNSVEMERTKPNSSDSNCTENCGLTHRENTLLKGLHIRCLFAYLDQACQARSAGLEQP